MPNNYILLETIALTQSAASVTFDNLPTSGYTDLKVVCSIRSSRTSSTDGAHIALTFNNNTGSIYSFKHIRGTGSAASSYGESNATSMNLYSQADSSSDTANTFSNNEIYIPNYRSGTNKSISVDSVYENNATTAGQHLLAGLFASNDAITSIKLAEGFGNNWVAGSTFSLYGVAALGTTPVLAPKATGGNIVANDGTYWYHAFTSSGNFVPQTNLTADVLRIAGGGAGAYAGGGGGAAGAGAGGLVYSSAQSLTAINYAVTVGAGGTGGTSTNLLGTNGNNSQFGSLTAAIGGGAGGRDTNSNAGAGAAGGSGGGGGAGIGGAGGAGGTGSQGNNGGSGTNWAGGGGGGAGAVGANATSGTVVTAIGGTGGAGTGAYSSWATPTLTGVGGAYAGGGGGASGTTSASVAGGSGGGGASGGSGTAGSAGVANTGSGGGGGSYNGSTVTNGGAGGSGIIIIRYPIAS